MDACATAQQRRELQPLEGQRCRARSGGGQPAPAARADVARQLSAAAQPEQSLPSARESCELLLQARAEGK